MYVVAIKSQENIKFGAHKEAIDKKNDNDSTVRSIHSPQLLIYC